MSATIYCRFRKCVDAGFGLIAGALLVFGIIEGRKAWTQRRAGAPMEARFLLALDATNTGLMEIASDGIRILYANDAAAKLFGYTPDELSGKSVSDLLPEWFGPIHQHLSELAAQRTTEGAQAPHVTVVVCEARTKGEGRQKVVTRVYVCGGASMFAIVNRAEDVRFTPMPDEQTYRAQLQPIPNP